MNEEIMLQVIIAGLALKGIDAVVLIIILSLERVKDNKKFKNGTQILMKKFNQY